MTTRANWAWCCIDPAGQRWALGKADGDEVSCIRAIVELDSEGEWRAYVIAAGESRLVACRPDRHIAQDRAVAALLEHNFVRFPEHMI